ncbi:MAG: hypothetical protein B6I29_01240 [Marinitoga sp. 4572_148]|nr:MAG: hypothetical protein B6I29_01240 [Marinitoga sp. 4572_148]
MAKKDDIQLPEWIEYSIPKWLYDCMLESFPEDYVKDFMKKSYSINPLTLRTNTLKITREELFEKLNDEYDIELSKHSPL